MESEISPSVNPQCEVSSRGLWYYAPVLALKPGALRNGAPFKDWSCRRPWTGSGGATPSRAKDRHAAEQDRPDILKRRKAWFEGQLDLDPDRLVFIDET